jgi:hypothetical protein
MTVVPTGSARAAIYLPRTHFARIKVKGKTIRERLETLVWTEVQIKLAASLPNKHVHGMKREQAEDAFAAALELFKKCVALVSTWCRVIAPASRSSAR